MGAPAGFLFGDSTPSPLTIDFIAFLRDTFDFAVEVLRSDARMAAAVRGVGQLADETEREVGLAEELAADLARALEGASLRAPTSLAGRCAARIQQGARDLVRTESEAARAAVAAERARLAQTASQEYAACAKAFEALVLRHTLPDAVSVTIIKLEGGARYEALLQCHTPYGVEWTLDLDVPPNHLLSRVLRIDRLVERLEVDAPEEGGWLHKEVRNRPQRIDRLHLTGLSVHPSETAVRLRAADDGSGAGFDVLFRTEPARIELVRIAEGGAAADAPYIVAGDDAARLHALRESLTAMAGELADKKKALRQASLDGTPIHKLESPRRLVETLIESIAPTVHEIASRSLAPGELVIKRLLGDNRREEVFVSKKELADKLESLPADLRAVFDPLGLWGSVSPAPVRVEASAGSGNGSPTVIVAPDGDARPVVGSGPPANQAVAGARIQMISSPPPSNTPSPPPAAPAAPEASTDSPPPPATSARPPRP
jgi:hypothetical protein